MLADVNGDNRQDVVGFGHDGVWLATSTGTSFSLAFVLTNFGYDQSWRVDKHVRTTGDINGDNMDDIVGFGDHGVWTALSTGSGFGPAQFVLTEFGIYAGGWHLDRHPRLLADINGDGKQDIVGFAEYGVWLSLATSSGYFSAPTFVVEDFGYDQGWRVGTHPRFVDGVPQTGCTDSTCPERGTHPRFVADLNGDGYQDIVGFGHDSVYRSLGGPGGFGPVRGVLRALVVEQGYPWNAYPDVVPDWHPRLVGDVTGDGKYDLVAFDRSDIMVAPSSDLPPPPPPAAPTNLGVTGKTTTSLTLVWSDNSRRKG
jgi:FG-GAP-like repeat